MDPKEKFSGVESLEYLYTELTDELPDGIASIKQVLGDIRFPTRKEELIKLAGDQILEFKEGICVALKDILEKSSQNEFSSIAEVAYQVSKSFVERTRPIG